MTKRSGVAKDSGLLDWAELPDGVRAVAIDVAARTLSGMDSAQIPAALSQVARFTPHKRAKRGALSLSKALDEDASFRALVASRLPASFGADPPDPIRACARAFLTRLPNSEQILAAARRADTVADLTERVAELTATVDSLVGRLAADASAAAAVTPRSAVAPKGEAASDARVEKLQSRLRQQGTRIRQLEDEAAHRTAEVESARHEADAHAKRLEVEAARWRQKAEQEAHRAQLARQAWERLHDQRTQTTLNADRRMALLLDTVIDAAAGLKREWKLATGGFDPADVVVQHYADADSGSRPGRPLDANLLLQWLRLPGAHLIVDGYNVTKTGYPELSLELQRDRLIRSLAALATRTGASVTAVFDGAAVVAPAASTREVRVVFSPAGVIADDVVRELTAAEPAGRVVIVASSDRELTDSVRQAGARVAGSALLLSVLG